MNRSELDKVIDMISGQYFGRNVELLPGATIFHPPENREQARPGFMEYLSARTSNARYEIAGVPLHPGSSFAGDESLARQQIETFCNENLVTYKNLGMNYGELTINGTVHDINPYGIDFKMMFEFIATSNQVAEEEGKVEEVEALVSPDQDIEANDVAQLGDLIEDINIEGM